MFLFNCHFDTVDINFNKCNDKQKNNSWDIRKTKTIKYANMLFEARHKGIFDTFQKSILISYTNPDNPDNF